jgi:hypothetical protein
VRAADRGGGHGAVEPLPADRAKAAALVTHAMLGAAVGARREHATIQSGKARGALAAAAEAEAAAAAVGGAERGGCL